MDLKDKIISASTMSNLHVLTLNTQGGYHDKLRSALKNFFQLTFDAGTYDFFLLQEVNENVLPLLEHHSYKLVRIFDDKAKKESEVCIVYRAAYKVVQTGFKSFAPLQYRKYKGGFKCPSFGVLRADIDTGSEIIRLVSLHVHSGTDRSLRLTELRLAKELACTDVSVPTIIGGDFNFVFPGEAARGAEILAPEFTQVTKSLAPTLDTRYCDNGPSLMTRVSSFLGRFNVGVSFHTDHFFINKLMADICTTECHVLGNRVSDHSPVSLFQVISSKN